MSHKPLKYSHSWSLKPEEAVALQRQLAGKVICRSAIKLKDVVTIAGVDTHYWKGLAIAAVVVVRLCDLATVDQATAAKKANFSN